MRFVLGTEPTVTSAQPVPHKHPKIDLEMKASLSFPNDIEGTLDVNLSNPKCERIEAPITVFGTKGSVTMDNYVVINGRPCNLSYKLNDGESTPVTDFEDFGGSPTEWTSYAYQLQAFVNKINGKEPHYWMESKDSILQQGVIDAVSSPIKFCTSDSPLSRRSMRSLGWAKDLLKRACNVYLINK